MVEFLDQQQSDWNFSGGSRDHWQSFTAGVTGTLSKISLYHGNPSNGSPTVISTDIYLGEGTNGTLLGSTTNTLVNDLTTDHDYLFNNISIVKDQKYTFRFRNDLIRNAWTYYSKGNSYTGGRNNLNDDYDYTFATYVIPSPPDPSQIPICFPKGTPVITDQGEIAIEKLNPDKHTIRGKEIVAITQSSPLQKHIVCFEKDSLSKNVPSQQTLCSMEHKVFYKGEMTKARNLVDLCENVTFNPYNGETLYNVLLKKHDKMMINNLICETLDPKNIAAKISTMKDGQKKNKVIQELNKIIKENNIEEYQKLYASL